MFSQNQKRYPTQRLLKIPERTCKQILVTVCPVVLEEKMFEKLYGRQRRTDTIAYMALRER